MYGAANYGRDVLLSTTSYPTGGMAMPDIDQRGGVFGSQGYGGGIFDGSMHGLGSAEAAAPVGYGTANYGRSVLLDTTSYPTGGMAMPDINPRGGVFGPQGYGGGVFDGSMHGLGQSTSAVHDWQALLNVELRDRGYEPVPLTGVVEPQTCGATMMLTNAYNAGEGIYALLADAFDRGDGVAIAAACADIPQPWPPPRQRVSMGLLWAGVAAVAIGAVIVTRKRRR